MSIQDIANVVNTLNRNLVRLAEKVATHDHEIDYLTRRIGDLELRMQMMEREKEKHQTVIMEVTSAKDLPEK